MKTTPALSLALWALLLLVAATLSAHSGRTDSNGCHTNRKTGDYHCHGKKPSSGTSTRSSSTKPKSKSWIRSSKKKSRTTKSAPAQISSDLLPPNPGSANPGTANSAEDPAIRAQFREQVIETVQNLLFTLGYKPGRLDGKMDRDTDLEIRQFQMDNNLPVDGEISARLLRELAVETRRRKGPL